jgi:hypothetical protein
MVRSIRSGLVHAFAGVGVLAMSACGGPGPGCHYVLSLMGQGLPASGGDVEVKVEAPAGCIWAFQGDAAWVNVHTAPPAPSGDGNGTVVATVAANTGARRVGTATIAYQRVTVDQAGTDGAGSCTFQIFPITANIGPTGGLGAFAVVPNAPDCSWWVEAHSPDDDWIDNDFHKGIGIGVSTYQVVPGTVFPSLPLPRTGRLGLHNSANALVTDHSITETP